ncbi:MAG TPA: MMPL family transporter [Acidimicrobiales bacterium]|nr:MMPL family transporter [Acidimicrobiales bacterium]
MSRYRRYGEGTGPEGGDVPFVERGLRRLARGVLAHRIAILVVTGLFVVVAAVIGGNVSSRLSQGGFDAPSEQSVQAADVLASKFHGGSDNFILLVHARHGTVDGPVVAAAGRALTRLLAAQPHMANVQSYWSLDAIPVLRTNNRTSALVMGRIVGDQDQITRREPAIAAAVAHAAGPIEVQVGGFAAAFHEVNSVVEHDLLRAEAFAVPLTLILLLFVFGSLVAAAMPLTIGAVAVIGTLLALRVLDGITPVSVFAVNLTTVLGLGLAIDYSLFVVSRFREELATGRDVPEALEETLAHAGRTVAGSALTVAAAVSALLVFPLMFLRSFAYAGIAVALLAGAAALVVLPAALALIGHRINALTVWRRSVRPPADGFWSKMARGVMRRPVVVIVCVTAVLLVVASPFLHLKLGYLDDRVLSPSNQIRQVDDTLRTDFGQGQTDALQVVAPRTGGAGAAVQAAYAARLSELPDVQRVDAASGVYFHGVRLPAPPSYLAQFAGHGGTWYSVVPQGNALSASGTQLVQTIRHDPAPFSVLVGGLPAGLADSTAVINQYLPLALLLVAAATFLLLLFLFRSVFIPIKALVLNALSLGAMFGTMVWIFQDGHLSGLLDFTPTGALVDTMPILMFCVAFGLSMDYEVFLVSRMKEGRDAGATNEEAVAGGLQSTGRIITAAALLMSIVFFGLVTSGIAFMKLFAVGLTFAVLLDAFVIRGMLVPAAMKLAGEAAWWAPHRRRRPPAPPPSHQADRYPIDPEFTPRVLSHVP